VGTIINPIAHQGQVDGGFMHGLGFAVMEELVIEDGKVATLSLGEYKIPTQVDMPPLHTTLLPTEVGPGPFGAKSAGELSNTAIAPAVANAVFDAVGVRITNLPVTSEKVLAGLRSQ
jgi:putative selenate reductase molybdopterin-binding subunit